MNTRDLIDLPAQAEADQNNELDRFIKVARQVRQQSKPEHLPPRRSILCLSGGGSYGAYSAGILCGWTCRGDRPPFDVVTGISTGALIAPFAFLGSRYDPHVEALYTTYETRDLYRSTTIRGFFGEAFADSSRLVRHVNENITAQVMQEIAVEHSKGRRLFIGTTESEGRRFIVWDIGAISSRGTSEDLALIRLILQGSSAIPGFFPPAKIPVTVDGRLFTERHIDGGTSQALFFRPPYIPPERINDADAHSVYNSDVYAIVAGKVFADPLPTKPRALKIVGTSVSTVLAAQTRGDLMRMWTVCQLTGMNYHMTAIPEEFAAPKSSTEFKKPELIKMFDEGVRQICSGSAWRSTPPGIDAGELQLVREGTNLSNIPQKPMPIMK